MTPYPYLQRTNERVVEESYRGDVFIWDIDKTYLDTQFSSFRGLVSIPFEFAIDKRALPGAVPLLRALRRGAGEVTGLHPLYFVSGSPPQLRTVIERKMDLDGVQYDGITFKDQWLLFKERRLRAIKAQIGYKLLALLLYRKEIPNPASKWLCFGDDVESDAEVFLLFDEVCAGLRGAKLESRLRQHGVEDIERSAVLAAADEIDITASPIGKIFIHLQNRSSPDRYQSEKIIATKSFIQTALVLAQMGRIAERDIYAVAQDLRRSRIPEAEIRRFIDDAYQRLDIEKSLLQFTR